MAISRVKNLSTAGHLCGGLAIWLLGSWPLWRDRLISVPGGALAAAAAALIKRLLCFFSKPQIGA